MNGRDADGPVFDVLRVVSCDDFHGDLCVAQGVKFNRHACLFVKLGSALAVIVLVFLTGLFQD